MADILECGHEESPHSEFTRGYGTDSAGNRRCYACCAERDKADMRATGRAVLYLSPNDKPGERGGVSYKLTNWPGSLSIPVYGVRTGRHNMAGKRYDFQFRFEGDDWSGAQYGDNTQIAHCRRLKPRK